MILYKYLGPERVDVLQNMSIRFTQPGLLNDPFESIPYLESYGPDEFVYKAIVETTSQLDPAEFEKLSKKIRGEVTFEEYIDFLKNNQQRVLELVRESESTALPIQQEKIYKLVNNAVGVLSLSEERDNLLMWAHYGLDHRGFVLGFDSRNDYFRPNPEDSDLLNSLSKVVYSKDRPRISVSDFTEKELLLQKSEHWKYEREWRFIRYLKDADDRKVVKGQDIFIFKIPPECFSEIIFGSRINADLRDQIMEILKNDDNLSRINLYQGMLDPKEYTLRIVDTSL